MANVSIQLHKERIYMLLEIESGMSTRAVGTTKHLKQYPEGEKLRSNWS